MRAGKITRGLFFVCFFGIGAASFSISILSDDLVRYYQNKQLLKSAEAAVNHLKLLNGDYDALLKRLESDPNLVSNIAPAELGTEPAETDAVYPKAGAEDIEAVRSIIAQQTPPQPDEQVTPVWVGWLGLRFFRLISFVTGFFLIIASFVFFGPVRAVEGKSR
jgi:hypothetical protein